GLRDDGDPRTRGGDAGTRGVDARTRGARERGRRPHAPGGRGERRGPHRRPAHPRHGNYLTPRRDRHHSVGNPRRAWRRHEAPSAMARTSTATATNPKDDGEGAFALEGFKLSKKLGRGPCGATYDAERIAGGGPIALKVLSRKFAKHPRTLAAVLDEARRAIG